MKEKINASKIRINIKNNLKHLRTSNNLKMREVAKVIGVKENTYRTWEDLHTTSTPKPDSLIALSRIYNVSVDFLMRDEEENIKAPYVSNNSADDIYGDKYLNELSAEEKMILMKYRLLSSADREKLKEYLESITDFFQQ